MCQIASVTSWIDIASQLNSYCGGAGVGNHSGWTKFRRPELYTSLKKHSAYLFPNCGLMSESFEVSKRPLANVWMFWWHLLQALFLAHLHCVSCLAVLLY